MIDFFDNPPLDLFTIICHTGGAQGSDYYFKKIGEEFGIKSIDYSYKTSYHKSDQKVEISEEDYHEGVSEIKKANRWLGRFGINKYMNLLARNWAQVKYSSEIFAIGRIVDPGKKGAKYYSKAKYQSVEGGTGYAVQMGINNKKPIFVFDQIKNDWFRWSYSSMSFVKLNEVPTISCQNFAGIGTREINEFGIKSIRDIYKKTWLVNGLTR